MTATSAGSTTPARRWLFPWAAGYQRAWLSRDMVAGIALGVVMIPQGMAYAELAGLPPSRGCTPPSSAWWLTPLSALHLT